MGFGLYAEMQAPRDKPHAELYRELLWQMEHADRAGFDVYSIIDHHFLIWYTLPINMAMVTIANSFRPHRGSSPGKSSTSRRTEFPAF